MKATRSYLGTDDVKQQAYWEGEHGHRAYDHPVVQSFAQQRIHYVQQFLDLQTVRSALDVGCGNGFSTFYMHDRVPQIWAVDRTHHLVVWRGQASRRHARG